MNDFRALAAEAGRVSGTVIIAIDELDKMTDGERVRELLRDIKGIFEVPSVHFLVSVSDEAAQTLHLGTLTGRNEFNSSFYTVLSVMPATPDQVAELLAKRSRSRLAKEVALTLAVLAGGNPREAVRLADNALELTTRVNGHLFLPVCGHHFSPLVAMVSPHWWPSNLPTIRAVRV